MWICKGSANQKAELKFSSIITPKCNELYLLKPQTFISYSIKWFIEGKVEPNMLFGAFQGWHLGIVLQYLYGVSLGHIAADPDPSLYTQVTIFLDSDWLT